MDTIKFEVEASQEDLNSFFSTLCARIPAFKLPNTKDDAKFKTTLNALSSGYVNSMSEVDVKALLSSELAVTVPEVKEETTTPAIGTP